jgi:hypothetical protein
MMEMVRWSIEPSDITEKALRKCAVFGGMRRLRQLCSTFYWTGRVCERIRFPEIRKRQKI